MNLANKITISRILMVPLFIILVVYSDPGKNVIRYLALGVFFLAAISDALDGFVARSFHQKTELGAYLDALADKLLLDSAFILLSYIRAIPYWLTILVISRDVIIIGGVMLLWINLEKLDIIPTITSKITTFFQMLTIIVVLLDLNLTYYIEGLTAAFTVFSGIGYIRLGTQKFNEIS